MRSYVLTLATLLAAWCPLARAGSLDINFFAELDGSFQGSQTPAPGRVAVTHDLAGSNFTDLGIAAFSDPNTGAITTIAKVDINNADTNLWGLAISRVLFSGAYDTTFGGGDGKLEFTTLNITNVIDACQDSAGRYVVAAAVPGANGSGGAKDLALLRFASNGAVDTSYSGDGKAVFSFSDNVTELDEAINDLECLPGGDYYIGGHMTSDGGRKIGFIAQLPQLSNHDVAVAFTPFGIASGELEAQVTAIHFNSSQNAYVVGQTIVGDTLPSRVVIQHYALNNGNAFGLISAFPNVNIGTTHCPTLSAPNLVGITAMAGTDYAISFLYTEASTVKAAVGRVNFGEALLVSCTQAPFSLNNAAVTPPLAYLGHVFVGLGVAPFNAAPVTSQVRAYVPNASGLNLLVESSFGNNGLSQWQHTFSSSNANNNRSFVQRLFVDPAGLIMAVGTRVWNGNDTDVTLSRLGSRGVFADGFENPP